MLNKITIDPAARFAISPRLYMQFMEPLGTTDSSVAAAWDIDRDDWREDVIATVRDLAPGMIRWGGILTSFWKWRESVGPADARTPMVNYLWGGVETNRVGVDEFLNFCERVAAEPLIAINFAADGRPEYIQTKRGENRSGDAAEAAALVRYCNDPDDKERRANGRSAPWGIKLWQIGNETSYPPPGERFTSAENAREYVAFAKAMRAADPSIQLIGWGDQERGSNRWWAPELLEAAAGEIDFVGLHMMHQKPARADTVLQGRRYRQDYDLAWSELMEIYDRVKGKLDDARATIKAVDPSMRVAITEGHLSLQPHNKCEILREWIAGLYHGKVLNLFERNADFVEVSTLADFEGQSWLVNAVLLGSPRETPYLLPVGHVMRLYRKYGGDQALAATASAGSLDIAASRRAGEIFLHVVNPDLNAAAKAQISIKGAAIKSCTAFEIAPGDHAAAIDTTNLDVFDVSEKMVSCANGVAEYVIPKASVVALRLEI